MARIIYEFAPPTKMTKPNGYGCGGCPQWDDVNGCWANSRSIGGSDRCYEEGGACYEGEENDEDDFHIE